MMQLIQSPNQHTSIILRRPHQQSSTPRRPFSREGTKYAVVHNSVRWHPKNYAIWLSQITMRPKRTYCAVTGAHQICLLLPTLIQLHQYWLQVPPVGKLYVKNPSKKHSKFNHQTERIVCTNQRNALLKTNFPYGRPRTGIRTWNKKWLKSAQEIVIVCCFSPKPCKTWGGLILKQSKIAEIRKL